MENKELLKLVEEEYVHLKSYISRVAANENFDEELFYSMNQRIGELEAILQSWGADPKSLHKVINLYGIAGDLTRMVSVVFPEEWDFINHMLREEEIDRIADGYMKSMKMDTETLKDYGMMDDYTPVNECLRLLMKEANARMWKDIKKEQVDTLIRGMRELHAGSVKLPNNQNETPDSLLKAWKEVNEKESIN